MRTATAACLGAALLISLPGCDFEEFVGAANFHEDFHQSYPLQPGGRLSVETFNGSVELLAWDNPEVDVRGTKSAYSQDMLDAIKIDVVAREDSVRIQALRPSGRHGNMGAKFQIRAPRRLVIELIETSNGSVDVQGTEGNARLRTSNGRVRVNDLSGDVDARTSNGGIELVDYKGSATLRTSNGGIKVDGIRGYLEAETSNSSITATVVEAAAGRPYRLRTSNGSINLTLEQKPPTDVVASTSNGSITLRLPPDIAAELDAETSNGSVSSDFDVTTRTAGERKNRLKGTIGGGGPLLDIHTSNGKIRIEKSL